MLPSFSLNYKDNVARPYPKFQSYVINVHPFGMKPSDFQNLLGIELRAINILAAFEPFGIFPCAIFIPAFEAFRMSLRAVPVAASKLLRVGS